MHVSRTRDARLGKDCADGGGNEQRCREMLKEALESFSPEGLEPGREISAVSRDGNLVLVYIPSEAEE